MSRIVGQGAWARLLRADIASLSGIDSNVLITGETGTGKGQVARALHEVSERSELPFVHLDCAALSPSLIESELFGHEKGAFTHALDRRVGRFELAGEGTVFLDEIGDLEGPLQAKLLRVLEDREFERVGGQRTLRLRARVIAATSRDLRLAAARGRFRLDLYYRLNVFRLHLPPLRERLEDLPALVVAGLQRASERLGMCQPAATPEFLSRLRSYDWPGNVRELMNLLERVVARADGGPVDASALDGAFERECIESTPGRDGEAGMVESNGHSLEARLAALHALERDEIVRALAWSGGNIAAAARRLRIPRGTLRHRMAKHHVSFGSSNSGANASDLGSWSHLRDG